MANCPSCGCRTAEAARFCPMCGVVINQEAVDARMDRVDGVPRRAEVPQPNERLVESYTTTESCGSGVAKAMRVLAALLAILTTVGAIAGGVMVMTEGEAAGGILIIIGGLLAALLIWFLLYVGVVAFENISIIARGTETQQRLSAAQLELMSTMILSQEESLRLNRQTVELLKVIDGERFDAAKQAESQTALLDKLTEQQQEQAARLAELKASGDAFNRLAVSHVQSMQSWKSESHRFIHAVALAISQLPDRLRDAINGTEKMEDETMSETAEEAVMSEEPVTAESNDDLSA